MELKWSQTLLKMHPKIDAKINAKIDAKRHHKRRVGGYSSSHLVELISIHVPCTVYSYIRHQPKFQNGPRRTAVRGRIRMRLAARAPPAPF